MSVRCGDTFKNRKESRSRRRSNAVTITTGQRTRASVPSAFITVVSIVGSEYSYVTRIGTFLPVTRTLRPLFSSTQNQKTFQIFSSYQILRYVWNTKYD